MTDFVWEGSAGTRRWALRGLWSYQQPGHKADWRGIQAGTRWDRRRQTEWEREGGGRGDCGTAPYPPVWVCSPGGPLLSWTGMQRADNHARGWIDVRTKWRQNNNTGHSYVPNMVKKSGSLIVFWAIPLVFLTVTPCSKHVYQLFSIWKHSSFKTKKDTCNKKKSINI